MVRLPSVLISAESVQLWCLFPNDVGMESVVPVEPLTLLSEIMLVLRPPTVPMTPVCRCLTPVPLYVLCML